MLASFVSSIVEFLRAHPDVAYVAVFLLALSESLPIIGVVVPGTAVILGLSTLVPSGVLLLWPLLIAATFGAIAGDGLSFWLGHRHHGRILGLWPLSRYPQLIERSEIFFRRHGDKSVFLARFAPGVRAFVPLLAGVLRMSVRRFYVVNIASALVWAPTHILPGVLVGATFSVLGAAAKPLAILLVVLIAMGWLLLTVVRWLLRRGLPLVTIGVERLRHWAGARETWLRRHLLGVLDPTRHDARLLAIMAVLLIGAAWLFLGILEDVVSGDALVRADIAVFQALQELRTAPGDTVMIMITEFGDSVVVVSMTIIVLLWLAWMRAWRTAAYWLVAIAGASALNTAIKVALHRARPTELLYTGWSAFSFPSGHSTINLVLYGFLAFLVVRHGRPAWRLPIAAGSACLVFLIAFSRLYLGAHWLSDVLGGLAFGSAWLALVGLFYLRGRSERIDPGKMFAIACAALVIAGGFNAYRHQTTDAKRYAGLEIVPTIPAAEWLVSDWRQLPARRISLAGELEEPLTFQWAGSLADLQDVLQKSGWCASTPWTLLSSLNWLSPSSGPTELPAQPLFASGRLPAITLIRPYGSGTSAGSRLVLRLWDADLMLADDRKSPLWVGSVVEEDLYHPFSLLTLVTTAANVNGPRTALADSLDGDRLVLRDGGISDVDWDGQVILAGPVAVKNPNPD